MAHSLWRSIVRDKLERLRKELGQVERHAEESDLQLARQTLTMAERSLRDIRLALDGQNAERSEEDWWRQFEKDGEYPF